MLNYTALINTLELTQATAHHLPPYVAIFLLCLQNKRSNEILVYLLSADNKHEKNSIFIVVGFVVCSF